MGNKYEIAVFNCYEYSEAFKKAKKLLLEQALKAHKVINTIPWQDHGQFIAEFASKNDAPDHFLLEGTVNCGKNGCGISGKLKIIMNSRPEFDKTRDGHFFRVYDPFRATIDYDSLMKSLNIRDTDCKILIPE